MESIQEHYKQQYSLTQPAAEYVGYEADGGPAKTKANATLTWQYKHLTLGWTTEYFDSYKQYNSPGSPSYILYGPSTYFTAGLGFVIPSQTYHNIFASYSFGKAGRGHRKIVDELMSDWTIQAGIKNLFNTAPPFDPFYYPYYYSPYGDPRLRDLWVSVKKEF